MIQFLWESIQWAFSDNLKTAITTGILAILFFPVRERITRRYGASFTLRRKKWVIKRLKRLTTEMELVHRGVIHLDVLRHVATIAAYAGVMSLAAAGTGLRSDYLWWLTPHIIIAFTISHSIYSLSAAFRLIRIGLYPRVEILSVVKQLDQKRKDELSDQERTVVLQYLLELIEWFPHNQQIDDTFEDLSDLELYLNSAHSIESEGKFKQRMRLRSKKNITSDKQ
ncbi:hypothetical protein [Agrobacterium fabrum]|uniref:hypothetical protein n=1 Tax=Agrobacterium fabrum TaxID=1176649 RepID=UPI000EF4FE66|nr:hypothetical protein [Agrobacterium fabrum]NSZ11087.1 hypothetical protein [Agrobacterium fabrum]